MALIHPNNSVSCSGDSSANWEVQLGLPFEGSVTPVSADLSADLKRADVVSVSVNSWAMDELKEGPYETMIRSNDALQDEFVQADRVIVENAVRIAGFSASFKFSKSVGRRTQRQVRGQTHRGAGGGSSAIAMEQRHNSNDENSRYLLHTGGS